VSLCLRAGHLGDLWDKKLPEMNRKWRVASPTTAVQKTLFWPQISFYLP
jgi:hypothetical protein